VPRVAAGANSRVGRNGILEAKADTWVVTMADNGGFAEKRGLEMDTKALLAGEFEKCRDGHRRSYPAGGARRRSQDDRLQLAGPAADRHGEDGDQSEASVSASKNCTRSLRCSTSTTDAAKMVDPTIREDALKLVGKE
jgi:hypothetical protein